MSNKLVLGLSGFTLCIGTLVACGSEADSEESAGVVQLAIGEVPADVSCLEIEVTANRKAEKLFDVTPGKTATVQMGSLPVGNVSVTALAYRSACAGVTPTSAPVWMSDAIPVTLIAGEPVNATLKLRKNGIGNFTAEFDDEDSGNVCPPQRFMCGTSCVDVQSDRNNCGACGVVCTGSTACIAGACKCSNNRQLCGAQCVDLQSDRNNCGACGKHCPVNAFCSDGMCELIDCVTKPGGICP
jgi:hypothetical protein